MEADLASSTGASTGGVSLSGVALRSLIVRVYEVPGEGAILAARDIALVAVFSHAGIMATEDEATEF
jgi:hypothetical protein